MNAIIESLCGPGGPGLSGNLVDSEGFPRADIEFRLFDRNVIGSLFCERITRESQKVARWRQRVQICQFLCLKIHLKILRQ